MYLLPKIVYWAKFEGKIFPMRNTLDRSYRDRLLKLEFQIPFEQGRAQFKEKSTKKINFFTVERLVKTLQRGGQTAKAKTNIM